MHSIQNIENSRFLWNSDVYGTLFGEILNNMASWQHWQLALVMLESESSHTRWSIWLKFPRSLSLWSLIIFTSAFGSKALCRVLHVQCCSTELDEIIGKFPFPNHVTYENEKEWRFALWLEIKCSNSKTNWWFSAEGCIQTMYQRSLLTSILMKKNRPNQL